MGIVKTSIIITFVIKLTEKGVDFLVSFG